LLITTRHIEEQLAEISAELQATRRRVDKVEEQNKAALEGIRSDVVRAIGRVRSLRDAIKEAA